MRNLALGRFWPLLWYLYYCIYLAFAHPRFAKELPHSDETIPGRKVLGHTSESYIQDLDNFGESFRKAGFKWTKEFCQEDSDGDGQSNGFELGDPFCKLVWRMYSTTLYFATNTSVHVTGCFIKDDTTRYRGATNHALSDPGNPESKSSRQKPCEFCQDKCSDNGSLNTFNACNHQMIFFVMVVICIFLL